MQESGTLKYRQIYQELRQAILLRTYGPGSFLPSEEVLTENYSCSRTTVRKAIALLREERLVEVRQGQGAKISATAATDPSKTNSAAFSVGWDYELDNDLTISSSQHVVDLISAPAEAAAALKLSPDAQVWRIQFIRQIETSPVSYVTIYVRSDYTPSLNRVELGGKKFYHVLEDTYGIRFLIAHEQLDAVTAGFMEANYLHVDIGTPLLRNRRIAECQFGPFEYAVMENRTDRHMLRIERSRIPRTNDVK